MKVNFKNILKFLFPEWQVIEIIKKDGFIAKTAKNQTRTNTVQMAQNGETTSALNNQPSYTGTPLKNQSSKTISKPINTAKSEKIIKPNIVDEKFDGLEELLSQTIVADKDYINSLCMAFKRPYVSGYNNITPKNVIFILGAKSMGKTYSIEKIADILKKRKIITNHTVGCVDLEKYPTTSEAAIFLSDIYKALYGQNDIVVFENYEKTHSSNLEIISQLVQEGKYNLNKRYALQNNMLIEATGTLLTNSIDVLNSNGKFFVFVSEKGENQISETFGTAFTKCIGDIILMQNFSQEEITSIANMLIERFIGKCSQYLKMDITTDATFNKKIISSFNPKTGVKGLEDYIENEIYKALSEYRLKNSAQNEEKIKLSYEDAFIAIIDDKKLVLSNFVKNYDAVAIDNVKRELNNVIGLKAVKDYVLNIEENLKVQNLRQAKGLKAADISMHMIFTGNPGTGKTTIARIVAKYLKAIGVLSSGQLREVSRADLVGQYVGQTAQLTNEVIRSSIGGVLFIDEAYSLCRDKNDTFGLEAIDALVKGMEDNRDDLVVILAGYEKEMGEFLKSNSGLKSRFPNVVNFEDYTPAEMYEISLITAKSKGYRIDEECEEGLLKLFEKSQIKGKNDSGNGRLVRNVVEAAILQQSKRIAKDNDTDLELLTSADFGLDKTNDFDLETELSKIIGLSKVKDFVRTQHKLLIAQEKRRKADLKVDTTQSLNMIFSGNPGTGKTTIARVVADMFKQMGILKSGHLVETDKGGLVAEYVGHTAKKTEEVFKSALGGVLFVDEAYAIASDGSSFGQEAIDTLVKLIEDYRGEIVVILAGYEKEMKDFLKANSGLESRFPLRINFPDYSADELFNIGLKMIEGKGFVLAEESVKLFKEQIYTLHKHSTAHSGNGRMVRNYIDELVRNQSSRIATSDVSSSEMNMILPEDIVVKNSVNTRFDLEKEFENVIGLESVKNYIRSLNARLRMQEERRKVGLQVDSTQTMHMIFKGNPGTGKTMMARTVANVLYNMGVIRTNKLVETDRAGLVAGYVGQTAIKTTEVIQSALDGVLFIDEAYALAQGGENDFGREAIDTLVKLMDDNRDRLVVILAGYSNDMDNFLMKNAGLKSRFANIIEFPDYSTDELIEIAEKQYNSKGYVIADDAKYVLRDLFDFAKQNSQFGNGRFVRNVFEKSVNNQALRLSTDTDLTKEELITITAEDIKEVQQ